MKKIIFAFLLIVLNANFAFAETVSQDTQNGCNFIGNATRLIAVFEINEYTCDSGEFLPANTLGCVACPSRYTCNGGTFQFNEYFAQGILYNQLATSNVNNVCGYGGGEKMTAVFEANEHTCTAGQYLPAGVDACTQCPANSYCGGGTFVFNETTDQGIVACDNGYHSSLGSSSASDCIANVITINWSGADAEDIIANNAGQCTYGGDIRTPVKAQHIPGQTFVGWTFDVQ